MKLQWTLTFLLVLLCMLLLLLLFFAKKGEDPFDVKTTHHALVLEGLQSLYAADLVDPEQAPSFERAAVLRGYHILMNTPSHLPEYARDNLSCTNCHFAEGDTLGGKNNGISLVGASSLYPKYSSREGKIITLAGRINLCFERSMNGRPVPTGSQEMHDMITYLSWISKEIPQSLRSMPWLDLPPLQSSHTASPNEGKQLYQTYCALCHHESGLGSATVPPLWGDSSFNDGAGMSHLSTLSSFIYWNMPYRDSFLTEEQALDVAAFILKQPRPHFVAEKSQK